MDIEEEDFEKVLEIIRIKIGDLEAVHDDPDSDMYMDQAVYDEIINLSELLSRLTMSQTLAT